MTMKTFKTYLIAAALVATSVSAFAQDPGNLYSSALITLGNKAFSVAPNVAADDQNQAILVRAIRSGRSFDVYTTTANNFSFFTDVAGSVLDTTINVQSGGLATCGATAGKLDVTDADCDTVGELLDHINASANWRAVSLDSLRSDSVATAAFLGTLTLQQANGMDGVAVKWITASKLVTIRALLPPGFRSMQKYLNPVSLDLIREPHNGYRTLVFKLSQSSAFTTTPTLQVQGVHQFGTTGQRAGVADVVNLYFQDVTAATGVAKVFDFTGGFALVGGLDEKIVVRVTGATVFTTERVQGYAAFIEYPR